MTVPIPEGHVFIAPTGAQAAEAEAAVADSLQSGVLALRRRDAMTFAAQCSRELARTS